MPQVNPVAASSAAVSLGQTVTAFTFFLPSLREVRQARTDDTLVRGDVRLGEFAAVALSVGIGMMMVSLTGSYAPATTAVITAGIIVGIYELAMNTERIME